MDLSAKEPKAEPKSDVKAEPKSDAEAKAKADAEWVDAAHDFIMVMTSAFRSGFAPSESA